MSSKNNVPIVLKNYHDFIFEKCSRFDNVDKVQLELVCQTIFTKLKKYSQVQQTMFRYF